jgi:ribonucleoside-triphosphate reductase (formate)
LPNTKKYEKYRKYVDFIIKYRKASNAATGSELDANANVENKNITTCSGELTKKIKIGTNRLLMIDKITEMYGADLANEYIKQIESHEKYKHDETSIMPYCVSITMYPFLTDGLSKIGGISAPPTNLESFCGSFVNLVFAVASQFAGAVSTPEFLMYMDYFIRKDYGEDYINHLDEFVTAPIVKRQRTLKQAIEDKLQQVVYSLNQPAAARDYQSVFWNIAYFDKPYFNGMFSDFVFPDGTDINWNTVNWLQKNFMKWFNAERLVKPLTFPVETVNLLDNGKDDYVDKEWADYVAEMYAEGHSFFTYHSDSVDSLSSCCRLKNKITENTFSFTLGAGGVSTGSKGVITTNINRLVQNATREGKNISDKMREETIKNQKYLTAFNEIIKDSFKTNMLSIYNAGFIELNKQYLTQGINGFVEGAEYLGIDISPNDKYFEYGEMILKPIYEENKKAKTKDIMFNTEFVPAENLGVKNATWDKKDGYFVPRDCYNSYFYKVEDESCNILDKFILHGDRLTRYLDGGSALHVNLVEHLTKEQYAQLLIIAIKTGCTYFTFNVLNTICNKCGYIVKHKVNKCPKCESEDVDFLTRIIGYLKRVSSFSEARQKEESKRYYEKNNINTKA